MFRTRSSPWVVVVAAVVGAAFLLLTTPQHSRAGDVETAKKHLEEAKSNLQNENWIGLEQEMASTEEFLDGVPEAEKAPVAKELAALKKQAEPKLKQFKSERLTKEITRLIDDAASGVQARPDMAMDTTKDALEKLDSDDAKKYLDAAAAKKLRDRATNLRTMAVKGAKKRVMDNAKPLLADLDKTMASDPFKGKDQNQVYSISQSLETEIKRIRGMFDSLPPDDPEIKAVFAKLDGYDKKLESMGAASEQADAVNRIADYWKTTKEYFKGWEAETAGPTWERYTKEGSQGMSDLLMPQTVVAINRTKYFLEDENVKKAETTYPNDATVKATMADARKTLESAYKKVNDNFNKLLEEAEKLPTPRRDDLSFNRPDSMSRDAERWFAGSKYMEPNQARAKKLNDKWNGALDAADKAKEETFNKMVEAARAAWPGIDKEIKAEDGFNPAEADKWKGKTIRLKKVRNRAGWDWSGYDFAMEINGMPVAGNYADNVNAAFKDVREKTGSGPDDHTDWDVIGVVQGPGQIKQRVNVEVRSGSDRIGSIDDYRTMPCTVIQVTGLYAPPIAIGPGMTVSAGSGGSSSSSSSGTGVIGWMWRIFVTLLVLAAAGLTFLKARPAAVPAAVAASPAGEVTTSMTNGGNAGVIGLVFMGLGLLLLLGSCIVFEFLPAVALIAAGAVIAAEFLRDKGLFKEGIYAKVKGLAIPIAGAAALIGVLHLIIGGWIFF